MFLGRARTAAGTASLIRISLNAISDIDTQIAQMLGGRRGFDAIHIIAHGAAGEVRLLLLRFILSGSRHQKEQACVCSPDRRGEVRRRWSNETSRGHCAARSYGVFRHGLRAPAPAKAAPAQWRTASRWGGRVALARST